MISATLISALHEARMRLPQETWKTLLNRVSCASGQISESSIQESLAQIANGDIAWALREGLRASRHSSWSEVFAAIATIDQLAGHPKPAVSIVWSGPPGGAFPARRVDQYLYDLLNTARHRVLLVTYAAHRIERLAECLSNAHARGVKITLLLETENDSDGQLSIDAIKAFDRLPLSQIELLQWPRTVRETNAAGRPGKLHAKCAVIDDTVLIGSANLTDDAFHRNMELGLATTDAHMSAQLLAHFRELQFTGILQSVVQ